MKKSRPLEYLSPKNLLHYTGERKRKSLAKGTFCGPTGKTWSCYKAKNIFFYSSIGS